MFWFSVLSYRKFSQEKVCHHHHVVWNKTILLKILCFCGQTYIYLLPFFLYLHRFISAPEVLARDGPRQLGQHLPGPLLAPLLARHLNYLLLWCPLTLLLLFQTDQVEVQEGPRLLFQGKVLYWLILLDSYRSFTSNAFKLEKWSTVDVLDSWN